MNLPWIGKGEGEERGRKKGKGREKDGGREGGRNRKKKHVSSCCLHVQCFSLHVDSRKTNIHTHKNNSTEEEPETDTLFTSRWATNGIHIHTQYYIHNIHRSMQYNNYV